MDLAKEINYLKDRYAVVLNLNSELKEKAAKLKAEKEPTWYLLRSLRRDQWDSLAKLLGVPFPKEEKERRVLLKLIRSSFNHEVHEGNK